MRQTILALLITGSCVALLGASIPVSSGMLDSSGILRFRYAEGATASLVCAPSFACDLVLQPGEVIEDVVSGNSIKRNPQGWIIAQGVQGTTPHVYFMPQTTSGLTNLIITTTRHSYAFYLVAAPSVRHWRYGFVYPNERLANSRPTASPTPAGPRDDRYVVDGDAPFAPVGPYSIGDMMYLPLPAGTYAFPDVEADLNGHRQPVQHTTDTDKRTIVVQGLYSRLVLFVGQGRHKGELAVTVTHQ